MTRLLEQTFYQFRQQSPEIQDCVAQIALDTMADEAHWQKTFAGSQSEKWLASQAVQVRAEITCSKSDAGVK